MLTNSGFSSTSGNLEFIIYFSSYNIYVVDTVFLNLPNNSTELSVFPKIFDNGTIYYSFTVKDPLPMNKTYDMIIIIKKNSKNTQQANFAYHPQKIYISISNYYANKFIPFTGSLSNINFDLEPMKHEEKIEFDARPESYIILIIFCFIAFGFLIAFICISIKSTKKQNKISFQPLSKEQINNESENMPSNAIEMQTFKQK